MTTSQNLALSFLLSQASTENTKVEEPTPPKSSKPRQLRAVKAKEVLPNNEGKSQAAVSHLTPGSIDAGEFMKRWRNATDRNDKITAIQLFIGYNHSGSFSTNEMNALSAVRKARQSSHPVTAAPSVQGYQEQQAKETTVYVAGLPDGRARRLADLEAREAMAADAMCQHELNASNAPYDSNERKLAEGMAQVERERLQAIRNDIKQLR